MLRISVRKLLNFSTEQLWSMLTGDFVLVFDDGEITTNFRRTLYSSHIWDVHRQFSGRVLLAKGFKNVQPQDSPALKKHHVDAVIKGSRLRSDTHLKLLGSVVFDLYDHAGALMTEEEKVELRRLLRQATYRITNNLYNDFSYRCEKYVASLDITHFLDIYDDARVQHAYETTPETGAGVAQLNSVIDLVLKEKSSRSNQLAKMYVSGLVKKDQLLQCLGWRGAVTDTNGEIFSKIVTRGYFEGICQISDSLQESRSASKSLELSKDALQNAEYFARRLQLVSMTLENLHHGDCGSTHYVHWRVSGPTVVDGRTTYVGDLPNLEGKYYLDTQSNKLKAIRATDTHLIGQVIKLRSVINCAHPDPAGVCSTCLGELALSVPEHSNIGHLAATYMTHQSTQGVLSTKHLDANASLEAIILDEEEKQYLKVSSSKNAFQLADKLKGKKVMLVVACTEAANLGDVMEIHDVSELSLSRVSEIKEVNVIVDDGETTREGNVQVWDRKTNRLASLTYELLAHVQKNGWSLTESGHYIIDLAGWEFNKPLLELPAKQFNMGDHSKGIAKILESSVEEVIKRDRISSPESVLIDLFTYVNSRLSVNLAMLEIPFYASMIVSAEEGNYSLPKPWTKRGLGVMRRTMDYRSASVRMAYERHDLFITNPDSFALDNRPESPFDVIFTPREVNAMKTRER